MVWLVVHLYFWNEYKDLSFSKNKRQERMGLSTITYLNCSQPFCWETRFLGEKFEGIELIISF